MLNFRKPKPPSLQQQGASPPDPHYPTAAGGSAPPMRISGYVPGSEHRRAREFGLGTAQKRNVQLHFHVSAHTNCSNSSSENKNY